MDHLSIWVLRCQQLLQQLWVTTFACPSLLSLRVFLWLWEAYKKNRSVFGSELWWDCYQQTLIADSVIEKTIKRNTILGLLPHCQTCSGSHRLLAFVEEWMVTPCKYRAHTSVHSGEGSQRPHTPRRLLSSRGGKNSLKVMSIPLKQVNNQHFREGLLCKGKNISHCWVIHSESAPNWIYIKSRWEGSL